MHVDGEQATEDTVTSNIALNSSEHDNEKAVPAGDDASHKDRVELKKKMAIGTLKSTFLYVVAIIGTCRCKYRNL